jgi:TonB family protein
MTPRLLRFGLVLGVLTVSPLSPAAQVPTPGQTSAQAPQTEPWPPAGVERTGAGIQMPSVVKEMKPNYTRDAMDARIEGVVEMQAVVETSGKVGQVRVVRSLDKEHGLDEEAVKALKQWTFNPGKKNGEVVPVLVNIEMSFALRPRR